MSICPDGASLAQRLRLLVVGLVFFCLLQGGYALDPSKPLSLYVHSQWGKDKGLIGETIYAICQSSDGFLWIGTDRGLVRFDGEKFTLIQQPLADQPVVGPVRGLVEDSEGNLWIRPQATQMLVYRGGRFKIAFPNAGLPFSVVTAMARDGSGGVLLSELISHTLRYVHGKFGTVANSTEAVGTVTSIAETRDSRIWLGTRDDGLFVIKEGNPVAVAGANLENDKINALVAANNGGLWIGTDEGLQFRSTRGDVTFSPPEWNNKIQIFDLTNDIGGNLWAASSRGLIRVGPGGDFSVIPGDGKKALKVTAVYADRDGNIWFGGSNGLERLQDGLFATYSSHNGFPSSNGGALYADGAKRIWFAPVSGGLYFLDKGRVQSVRLEGLEHDLVYSISGNGNEIWVGRQHGGLARIKIDGDSLTAVTFTNANGLAQNTVFATYAGREGDVWAGTISGGLSRWKDGRFTNFSMSNGLSSNAVNSIAQGQDGTIYIGTSAGLDGFRNGAWSHWSSAEGLPASEVRSCFEDSQHVLWLVTASSLAFISSGKLVVPNHIPESLRDQLFGITEDDIGALWILTSNHVVRVNRERLLDDSLRDNDVQVIGEPDGLIGIKGIRRDRSILTAPDGRVWVSVQNGIAYSDPAWTLRQSRPLPARIESITAGGKTLRADELLRIPARTHNVIFQFSGASLSSPERMWYRYRLEGADSTWSDPVQMRQVGYNNLHFGNYRFRVVASQDGALWNGPEGQVTFTIDQAFWETWWFRTAWLLLAALTVVLLIRLRMLNLSRQLNARFQERLSERTRIAQELHDTLLQSFHGLLLRFETVDSMLPERVHEAKVMLGDALDLADNALNESREAIQNIRSSPVQHVQLTQALASLLEQVQGEFSGEQGGLPSCSIVVEGSQQALRDEVADEICRIAREALRNVFQHARASNLEIEISFRDAGLRLSFRDDGVGIESSVLKDEARSGHWGLIGMRERAIRLGGELTFWSKPGAGTEIVLTIPGHLAYTSSRLSLFRRLQNRR